MKAKIIFLALFAAVGCAHAESWVYQGHLDDGGKPANGSYTLRLTLLDMGETKKIAPPLTLMKVDIKNGQFKLDVDFGMTLGDLPAMKLLTEVEDESQSFIVLGEPKRFDPKATLEGTCWDTTGNSGISESTDFLGTLDPAALNFRVFNQRNFRIETGAPDRVSPNIIGGSPANYAGSGVRGATIAGGGVYFDTPTNYDPDFTGEGPNRITDAYGFIGGGFDNIAGNSTGSAIDGAFAVVAGGRGNFAQNSLSSVGGGLANQALGFQSTIPGGHNNIASGAVSIVSGGGSNCAGGDYSWVGGRRAKVRAGSGTGGCPGVAESLSPSGDMGTFVWNDALTEADFTSTGPNQFLVNARGGFALNAAPPDALVEATVTSNGGTPNFAELWLRQSVSGAGMVFSAEGLSTDSRSSLSIDNYNGSERIRRATFNNNGSFVLFSDMSPTPMGRTGVILSSGSGSWSTLSDRSLKIGIKPIQPMEVLNRLLAIPLSTWSYIAQGETIRHMGPMAQDFANAFSLGESDTHISTVDADGVALAAIQGLNAKLEQENEELKNAQQVLSERLEKLQAQLNRIDARTK